MDNLDMDKCTEQFTLRIPEVLKGDLDKLTKAQKTALIQKIILVMAKAVHNSKFDPEFYIKSDNV